jgi:hypothetical protein
MVPCRTRRPTPEITSAGIIRATRIVLPALGVVMARTHAIPVSGTERLTSALLSRK